MKIVIADYHKGNLKSVERGLSTAGADVLVTDDASALARADAIVLPGVGSFTDASASMRSLGQMDVIRDRVAAGVPFLGICLGLHLMFEAGVEGSPQDNDRAATHHAPGLALLPGVVGALPKRDEAGTIYKIPHVGWNSIECDVASTADFACPLLRGIQSGEFFYFTHGYCAPETSYAVAKTVHSTTFPSVVAYRDTAFGVQFHPEKSSDAGAVLLRNFVNIAKGV